MRILIIEDEQAAATRMRKMLTSIEPSIEVLADLPSVAESVEWFKAQPAPDLVFMDVQLADGDSFEIFKRVDVPCPVVFTTAYDEYALNAFRVNALDYLLKPIRIEDLETALQRAERSMLVRDHSTLHRQSAIKPGATPIKRFLIRYGEHFKVVEPEQIAYVHSLMKNTFLRTKEGRDLPLEESLDKLEAQLDPQKFIRLNRQLIVHLQSIKELLAYSKSRVKVVLDPPYGEDAIVSSERSAAFKRWLAGE
ncbi:MAG: response regulator transcription factor [Flavobacteriales bacterium]|mgnify:FL=1|jgi:DNA-binding LytR/AlgR family response regulator|nr:response regulator transcription factor [Flavobacteriales bacterium]HOZ39551.1 LytTR family DNA-binding domain-containing protein [Flavobacteriales bacterium]